MNGGFSVVIIILGTRLNWKVKAVRNQVENGHATNMREEGDERHEENTTKLDQLLTDSESLSKDVHRVRDSVSRLWQIADGNRERIHDLELKSPARETFEPTPAGRHKKETP